MCIKIELGRPHGNLYPLMIYLIFADNKINSFQFVAYIGLLRKMKYENFMQAINPDRLCTEAMKREKMWEQSWFV